MRGRRLAEKGNGKRVGNGREDGRGGVRMYEYVRGAQWVGMHMVREQAQEGY